MQACELGTRMDPKLHVEVREGLVEQEDLRLAGDGPAEGHALPLAPGQRRRFALEERFDPEALRHLGDPIRDDPPVEPTHLEAEREVLAHRHVGIEGVVLEDHGDVAPLRRQVRHVLAIDEDAAATRGLDSGRDPQEGALAAARRTEQDDELPLGDLEIHPGHGRLAARIGLLDAFESEGGHASFPSRGSGRGLGGGQS